MSVDDDNRNGLLIEITDEERLAAVRAIQSLGSYTWERVIDTAVEAVNDYRRRLSGER